MKLVGSNSEKIINSKKVEVFDFNVLKDTICPMSLFEISSNKRGLVLGFTVKRDFKIIKNGSCIILLPEDAEIYDFEEEIKLGDDK